MATATTSAPPQADRLILSGINWQTYSRLLHALGEQPGVFLTYDRGEIEIMSPLRTHENIGHLLSRMIITLTEELNLPIEGAKSTTLRRRKKQRGLEPDDCFWIVNEPLMRGKDTLDLRIDPPPDLALEIDMTKSSMDRMSIYASLGVPEVWRYVDDVLSFHVKVTNKRYKETGRSQNFPMIAPADLVPILALRREHDHNAIIRQFRAWLKQRLASEGTAPLKSE